MHKFFFSLQVVAEVKEAAPEVKEEIVKDVKEPVVVEAEKEQPKEVEEKKEPAVSMSREVANSINEEKREVSGSVSGGKDELFLYIILIEK